MSDKDLLVVVSEMLRKQDQHSELISKMLVKQDQHSVLIKETNDTLKQFVGISVQQFEQKMKFNERFLTSLESMDSRLSRIDTRLNRNEDKLG